MNEKIVGIIPARGGSKRIPDKNIKDISGKPLIAYTIIEAKKSKYLDRLIVTTDDEKIAKISRSYGADVPFIRPKELAKDKSNVIDTLIHAVNYLESEEKYSPDIIVLLEPTSPLRTVEDVDSAIKKHLETNADSIVGVVKGDNRHPLKAKIIKDNKLVDYLFEEKKIIRSQDLPEVYFRNGAYYSVKKDVLMSMKTLYGKDTRPYIMSAEKSIDINEELDFKIAEILLNRKGK